MDLRQIEYIIAIEQEESISKAAEKLFITQSALNQQLLKLEKELGMPLFERKKRQMIPHRCRPDLSGDCPSDDRYERRNL